MNPRTPAQGERTAKAKAQRQARDRESLLASYWWAIDLLRRNPSEQNARSAKQAFFTLAKVYHPDQGGTHEQFLRLKETYDRAKAAWKRAA